MTSFSDQLSNVRQSQWETQLEIFRKLSSRALDSTEQLIALNMRASRASMEHATGTVKQLLEVNNPRDLFAVGSNVQGQWHELFAYGRELMGIASELRGSWSTLPSRLPFAPAVPVLPHLPSIPTALHLIPAPSANLPASPSQAAEQLAIASAEATTVASEIGMAASDIGNAMLDAPLEADAAGPAPASEAQTEPQTEPQTASEPDLPSDIQAEPPTEAMDTAADAALAFADAASDAAIADDVPPAKPTLLAKALNEIAPKPASVLHPIASTVALEAAAAEFELPAVAPVEHTPPVPTPAPPPEPKPARAPRKK